MFFCKKVVTKTFFRSEDVKNMGQKYIIASFYFSRSGGNDKVGVSICVAMSLMNLNPVTTVDG